MRESELKACPFCGPGQSVVGLWHDDVAQRWRVGCGRCGCSTGISPSDKTEAPAIKAWNTRAPQWQAIESAPEKVRVLVCGGDTPNKVSTAINDPDRYTPWHESHAALPRIQAWYSETTRGSGKIWPAPTHWQPLPAPPEVEG